MEKFFGLCVDGPLKGKELVFNHDNFRVIAKVSAKALKEKKGKGAGVRYKKFTYHYTKIYVGMFGNPVGAWYSKTIGIEDDPGEYVFNILMKTFKENNKGKQKEYEKIRTK